MIGLAPAVPVAGASATRGRGAWAGGARLGLSLAALCNGYDIWLLPSCKLLPTFTVCSRVGRST